MLALASQNTLHGMCWRWRRQMLRLAKCSFTFLLGGWNLPAATCNPSNSPICRFVPSSTDCKPPRKWRREAIWILSPFFPRIMDNWADNKVVASVSIHEIKLLKPELYFKSQLLLQTNRQQRFRLNALQKARAAFHSIMLAASQAGSLN